MATISRVVIGGILIVLGLSLGYQSFVVEEFSWVLLIYGLLSLGFGIFILFNKKEDEIEQVKQNNLKTKVSKKKTRKKL